MGTAMWKGLVIVAGAALLIVTTGTAVVAMINDDDDGRARVTSNERPLGPQGGGAISAVCAPDVPDCQDTIVEGDGFEQCATEEPCGDFDYAKCAADTECIEPMLAPEIVCPEGASVESCFPAGLPAGFDCLERESFPVQVVCFWTGCVPYGDDGVTTVPAPLPVEPRIGDEPLVDPVDPDIAVGEPAPPTEVCVPPVDCALEEVVIEGCLGTPCNRSSELNARCLPPDCAISSDGAISCPLPEPCISIDSEGVTAPQPAVCESVEPPAGGSDGGEGSPGAEATAVATEPQ